MQERIFSYAGQHLNIPPTAIAVRTVQKPMPPIWVTSGHPETLGRAIRDHHHLFVTALLNGTDAIKALRERLEGIAAKEGRSIDDVGFGFLRCGYASDNENEITSYLDNARFQRRLSESLKFRRAQSDDSYLINEEAGPNDMSLETMRKNLPVGSVNQVIERMLEEISILKPLAHRAADPAWRFRSAHHAQADRAVGQQNHPRDPEGTAQQPAHGIQRRRRSRLDIGQRSDFACRRYKPWASIRRK